MEWTKRNDTWRSGPYTIELLAPEHWVLSRETEIRDTSQVRASDMQIHVDDWWTGRSLRAMKRKAESMAAKESQRRDRNRYLAIMFVALLVLPLAYGASGPVAVLSVIAAVGVMIYGLIRAVDASFGRHPWERLNETYQ